VPLLPTIIAVKSSTAVGVADATAATTAVAEFISANTQPTQPRATATATAYMKVTPGLLVSVAGTARSRSRQRIVSHLCYATIDARVARVAAEAVVYSTAF